VGSSTRAEECAGAVAGKFSSWCRIGNSVQNAAAAKSLREDPTSRIIPEHAISMSGALSKGARTPATAIVDPVAAARQSINKHVN
jgi:hypothetical protein